MISGYTKTTLLDYPEHIASTLFLSGCNFLCPFCHNRSLVLDQPDYPILDDQLIFDDIKKRKHLIEGVVLTGGEPTLAPNLISFITQIKELGLKVKLDTNGSNPFTLEKLLQQGLLDYVAMDIKASKADYAKVCGLKQATMDPLLDKINKSLSLVKKDLHLANYEFRTTVIREFHDRKSLSEIAKWILPANNWYLQAYRYNENQISPQRFHPIEKESLERFLATLDFPDQVHLRGY